MTTFTGALMAAQMRNKDKPKVTLPVFGDQLSEVRKQLAVLNNLFEKLSSEYDQHIARQVIPQRPFATQSTLHVREDLNDKEGQPPRELLEGQDEEAVKVLIAGKKLDPNATFENFRCNGKDFSSGSALAIAVLRGNREMVEVLVDAGADADSTYSFVAGAEQQTWSGTAINAAIPTGNLDMVKLLVKLEADINTVGSNGANLVWQASYFNQTAILEYLLENDGKVNVPATSQDNSKVTYTPLHAASIAGHTKVVQMLLDARAKHSSERETRQPLEDAIQNCHSDLVKVLLVAKADLFGKIHPETKASHHKNPERCIDLVFESSNPVMLSQVAQGISQSSCERMSKADFIRFLNSPGEAPYQILDAIFQRFAPRYWEEEDGKRFRMLRTAAFVDEDDAVNIEEGPNYRVILNAFNKKQLLSSHIMAFMEKLLPQKPFGEKEMLVPVTTYMCHIPMLHKDLQVLLAIEDCKNPQIFSSQGCQAIINLAWRVEKKLARFRMMLALIEVLMLFFINLALNNNEGTSLANTCSLLVWLLAALIEIFQIIGYASRGLLPRYLTTYRYWFDFLVLLLTGCVNISLMAFGDTVSGDTPFRTAFGVLSFLKWMRFLTFLRQFKQIGINILPITATMWDSVPFGLVLGIYMIGSVSMYYALGLYPSLFDSFLLVYRLIVLGDMDFAEMENIYSPTYVMNTTTGWIEQTAIVSDQHYEVVRLFVVFVSFVMGLTMMNLFVAILCLAYSVAAEEARNSFMRSLTGIVLDQRAIRLGLRALCCRGQPNLEEEDPESNSATLRDESVVARKAYVWFAVQTK